MAAHLNGIQAVVQSGSKAGPKSVFQSARTKEEGVARGAAREPLQMNPEPDMPERGEHLA